MASPDEHFLSIDWGTTNFRLRVVATASLQPVLRVSSDVGVRSLYERFQQTGGTSREDFFRAFLLGALAEVPTDYRAAPLVMSGMGSSSIGLRELPYSSFPLAPSGRSLVTAKLSLWPGQRTLLVSGVCTETAFMRGEETQAIGLAEEVENSKASLLILPGTHCKYLAYAEGQYRRLDSFMTGELFELLSKRSILAASVRREPLADGFLEAFLEGVRAGAEHGLSGRLLDVRANDLFSRKPPGENYYFLSGLVIGDELAALTDYPGGIVLGASGPTFELYQYALSEVVPHGKLHFCDADILDHAFLVGQRKLLLLNDD